MKDRIKEFCKKWVSVMNDPMFGTIEESDKEFESELRQLIEEETKFHQGHAQEAEQLADSKTDELESLKEELLEAVGINEMGLMFFDDEAETMELLSQNFPSLCKILTS